MLAVGPLGGLDLRSLALKDWAGILGHMLILKMPTVNGAFPGLPIPALNGSMWTIVYEARCYVLAATLGLLGFYKRRWMFFALLGVMVLANLAYQFPVIENDLQVTRPLWGALGEPGPALQLTAVFLFGAGFRMLNLRYRGWVAGICAAVLAACLFSPRLDDIAIMSLGGYALFWLALNVKQRLFLTINAKDDISYGVYLYAWPIGELIIWFWRAVPLPVLILATFAGAYLCGALSWNLIEKPALALKGRGRRRTPGDVDPPGGELAPP